LLVTRGNGCVLFVSGQMFSWKALRWMKCLSKLGSGRYLEFLCDSASNR